MHKSRTQLATNILRAVADHPANAGRVGRAVLRTIAWQVYKRVVRRHIDRPFLHGTTIRCYPDSGAASNCIYFNSRHDFAEMSFVERYLRPGDAFIDVGANIGTYTLLAAAIVGSTGEVHAFEPHDRTLQRLRENVQLNRFAHVRTYPWAVTDKDESGQFVVTRDVSNRLRTYTDLESETVVVKTCSLDAIFSESGRPYALAKVDVEGVEPLVLKGATRMLATGRLPVLLLEFRPDLLRKRGADAAELLALARRNGHLPFAYLPETRRLAAIDDLAVAPKNILLVHEPALPAVQVRIAEARP